MLCGGCLNGYQDSPAMLWFFPNSSVGRVSVRRGGDRKIVTRGFVAFSWYVKTTMVLCAVILAPLVLLYVLSDLLSGLPGSCERLSVSRRKWADRGVFHGLLGPKARQFFVYWHMCASNMVFFSLVTATIFRIVNPAMVMTVAFQKAALVALVPTGVLWGLSAVYSRFYRIFHCDNPLLLKYNAKSLWYAPEEIRERLRDSATSLMSRDQFGDLDSVSMTSLSRLDKQLMLGVPTAIVGICCYGYDLHVGHEQEALDQGVLARKHLGGVVGFREGGGFVISA